MARNLALKTNVEPADSDYPYGKIKDDSGSGDGTPVNELVYGDMHQFFARMFAKSGLVYNNLPDSDYSDFQFFEAAQKLWKKFGGVNYITSTGTTYLTRDKYDLCHVINSSANNIVWLYDDTVLEDGDTVYIYNQSNYNVRINPSSANIFGDTFIYLYSSGDFVNLVYDKANTRWVYANKKITAKPVIVSYSSSNNILTTANTNLKLQPSTIISDIDGQYSSGNFTPKKVGFYNFSAMFTFYISAISTNETISIFLYKNSITFVNRCAWVKSSYDGNGLVLTATLSTVIEATNLTDNFQVMFHTGSNRSVEIDGVINYNYISQ